MTSNSIGKASFLDSLFDFLSVVSLPFIFVPSNLVLRPTRALPIVDNDPEIRSQSIVSHHGGKPLISGVCGAGVKWHRVLAVGYIAKNMCQEQPRLHRHSAPFRHPDEHGKGIKLSAQHLRRSLLEGGEDEEWMARSVWNSQPLSVLRHELSDGAIRRGDWGR